MIINNTIENTSNSVHYNPPLTAPRRMIYTQLPQSDNTTIYYAYALNNAVNGNKLNVIERQNKLMKGNILRDVYQRLNHKKRQDKTWYKWYEMVKR